MNVQSAISSSANLSDIVIKSYLSDLDDADLMTRPGEGCNHLAWQLGHLIASEVQLLEGVAPGKGIHLPEGFADSHSKETSDSDQADKFLSKQAYIDLYEKVREASKKALDTATDEQLTAQAPEQVRSFCPTVGDVFVLIASHPMMHAGQFAVVRRKLGKPILM
jgi:uncharacterized damage-inducible protein DinB